MKEQIPINENMPEDLKAAINYLNDNQISLNDKFDISDDELEGVEEDIFEIPEDSFDEEIDFGDDEELEFDDEEDNEDILSDLNSIF